VKGRTNIFWVLAMMVALVGCKNDTFNNSVPRYPVNISIDTRSGVFVHFVPTALNTFVIVNAEGYHYNGEVIPRLITNAYGYGGVLVYIDINGNYNAWDLACPYCAGRGVLHPCDVDGIFATCPECGEQYDVGSGTAVPQKGLAREPLLRIPLTNSGGVITVRQ